MSDSGRVRPFCSWHSFQPIDVISGRRCSTGPKFHLLGRQHAARQSGSARKKISYARLALSFKWHGVGAVVQWFAAIYPSTLGRLFGPDPPPFDQNHRSLDLSNLPVPPGFVLRNPPTKAAGLNACRSLELETVEPLFRSKLFGFELYSKLRNHLNRSCIPPPLL